MDWTVKENVKADIRARVRRILNKYGYPPDKKEKATQLVLEKAEVICMILSYLTRVEISSSPY